MPGQEDAVDDGMWVWWSCRVVGEKEGRTTPRGAGGGTKRRIRGAEGQQQQGRAGQGMEGPLRVRVCSRRPPAQPRAQPNLEPEPKPKAGSCRHRAILSVGPCVPSPAVDCHDKHGTPR